MVSGGVIIALASKVLNKQITKNITPVTDELKTEIKAIREEVKKMDVGQCQNFLVRCFDDLENGVTLTESVRERMCECYDHYTKDLNQNSYIHKKWDKLMK